MSGPPQPTIECHEKASLVTVLGLSRARFAALIGLILNLNYLLAAVAVTIR